MIATDAIGAHSKGLLPEGVSLKLESGKRTIKLISLSLSLSLSLSHSLSIIIILFICSSLHTLTPSAKNLVNLESPPSNHLHILGAGLGTWDQCIAHGWIYTQEAQEPSSTFRIKEEKL
jgi:hypothetical protein